MHTETGAYDGDVVVTNGLELTQERYDELVISLLRDDDGIVEATYLELFRMLSDETAAYVVNHLEGGNGRVWIEDSGDADGYDQGDLEG